MLVSNSSFGMCSKIAWISWITWASVSKFHPCSSYFNDENNYKSRCVRSGLFVVMFYQFNVVALKPLLYKSSRMWVSIVLIKNPPLKKSHYFHVLTSRVFFFYQEWSEHLSSLPMLSYVEHSSHFWPLLFSGEECTIIFTKPAVISNRVAKS